MTELTTKTPTADTRMGSHSETSDVMKTSFGSRLRCRLPRPQSRIEECLPGGAQRAFARRPHVERNARHGFDGHTPLPEERPGRGAQCQQGPDHDGFGAVLPEFDVGRSHRGAGADRVVHDGEALVAHAGTRGRPEADLGLVTT